MNQHPDEGWFRPFWPENANRPMRPHVARRGHTAERVRSFIRFVDPSEALEYGVAQLQKSPEIQAQLVARLLTRVEELTREVAELRREQHRVVVIREVPVAEAKQQIVDYYRKHAGQELYPSDVAAALCLDAENSIRTHE